MSARPPFPVRLAFVLMACGAATHCPAAESPGVAQRSRATTIAQLLVGVRHVGVFTNQEWHGYGITVYSEEQQLANIQSHKQYYAAMNEYRKKRGSLERKRAQAEARKATYDEVNAIIKEMNALDSPPYPLAKDQRFYKVLGVGSDFIELRREESDSGSLVIPLGRISAFIWPSRERRSAEGEAKGE